MKKQLSFFFPILILMSLVCCKISSSKTVDEKKYELGRYNEILPGVYDSLSIVFFDSISGYLTPMAIFFYSSHHGYPNYDRKLRSIFSKMFKNKTIHPFIKKKHFIRALSFEENKKPFSSYEMDYDILIQIDNDTFRYEYIAPENFKKFDLNNGINIEPRFFWDVYKNEPEACDFIAEQMFKNHFLQKRSLAPVYFYWLNKTIIKHNSSVAKELFCYANYYKYINNGIFDGFDKNLLSRLKEYNCSYIEEMTRSFEKKKSEEKK